MCVADGVEHAGSRRRADKHRSCLLQVMQPVEQHLERMSGDLLQQQSYNCRPTQFCEVQAF